MTNTFKPQLIVDDLVPEDTSDPLMPKYVAPLRSTETNPVHKLHRRLLQAQQIANNHLEKSGNLKYFVASAEYVDCRNVREQDLDGAEVVDEVDVVVYVLSKDMNNQTGAAVRLPPGRIDGAALREMLDAAMDYVARDHFRRPEETVTRASVAAEAVESVKIDAIAPLVFEEDDSFYDSGCPCCQTDYPEDESSV